MSAVLIDAFHDVNSEIMIKAYVHESCLEHNSGQISMQWHRSRNPLHADKTTGLGQKPGVLSLS